ncbi:MAG: hypothetical protein FJZ09_02920 [Candidatus Omnitrophica bacterium]|nr:hypothetical protein [Candidatus Omnitrophota bacterium]
MSIINFFLLNLPVAASASLVTYRLVRPADFIDSLILWFLLFLAQVISVELILGISGLLFLNNLFLLNLAVFLAVWLSARRRESSFDPEGLLKAFSGVLSQKPALFLITAIASFGLVKIAINLVNPPFGWDSLNYHFTFAVEWLKSGTLNTPITVFDDPSPTYYPINGSLYFLWFIFPLKNVFLADLGQLPFFILAFFCIFNISRKAGLDKMHAFYAAALFALIPNFFKQLQIAYVDMMVAGLFFACLNFLFELDRELNRKNVFAYTLGLGLLLGTKTVGLPYSFLLFVPLAYLLLRDIKRAYFIFMIIPALIFLGGFSYIRNFLETGNPLYPLDFKLFGRVIFNGAMDLNTYRAHFKPEDYKLTKALFHEGLGVQTLVLVLSGVLFAPGLVIWKRRKELSFFSIYFAVLPILLYLTYRYVIPLANLRYLYPFLGIGVILGFYAAQFLRIPRPVITVVALVCSLASMSELAKRQELVTSMLLTFTVFILIMLSVRFIRLKRPRITSVRIFLSVLLLAAGLIFLEKWYLKNEFQRYIKMVKYSGFWPDAVRAWHWLNNNTAGNNIAYAGRPVPFPLYGTNFKNNVYYVSVNGTDPVKLHFFKDSRYVWGYDFLSLHRNLEAEGNYRGNAQYGVWLRNLLRRNTDYLFIYSLHQTKDIAFPVEDGWAKAHPEAFNPVFNNDTVRIYKVRR